MIEPELTISNPAHALWRWLDFGFGFFGLLLGLLSIWQSHRAAVHAKGAESAAKEAERAASGAWDAAMNFARHDRVLEIEQSFGELHQFSDLSVLLSLRCIRLRVMIAQFKEEGIDILGGDCLAALDTMREQLSAVMVAANNPRLTSGKASRIAVGLAVASDALGLVKAKVSMKMKVKVLSND